MNTDDLREEYGKSVSFNCEKGDEAFTDGYVMWLEKQLLIQRVNQQRELLFCGCKKPLPEQKTTTICCECNNELKDW